MNGIIMEAIPFCKVFSRMTFVIIRPLHHLRLEIDICLLAVLPDHLIRVIKHIIRIQDGQTFLINNILVDEEIEEPHKLLIAGLVGEELVPARYLLERRDSTAEERGDGAARMADEECKVEFPQNIEGKHRRISALHSSAEREGDFGWLTIRGEEVIRHILDENALTLVSVSVGLMTSIVTMSSSD